MSWEDTVREKMQELEMIATWASPTNQGSCRDHCREAIADLRKHLELRENYVRPV